MGDIDFESVVTPSGDIDFSDAEDDPVAPVLDFAQGANVGIADIAGIPGDAATWASNLIFKGINQLGGSIDLIENGWLGSKSIQGAMNFLAEKGGMDPFAVKRDTVLNRMGYETGANALGFGVVGGVAKGTTPVRAGAPGVGKIRQTFEPMLDIVRKSPALALATDIGISLPAGAGAYAGREYAEKEFGEHAGMTGEIVGQLAGTLAPAGAIIGGGQAIRKGAKALQYANDTIGITKKGKGRAATGIVRKEMEFPESSIIDPDEVYPLYGEPNTAEYIGDPKLLKLQSIVDAEVGGESIASRRARQNASLHEGMATQGGSVTPEQKGTAANAFNRLVEKARLRIRQKTESKLAQLKETFAKLDPDETPAVQEKIVREHMESARTSGETQVKRVWGAVGDGRFSVKDVRADAQDIINSHPSVDAYGDPRSIPAVVYEIAGVPKGWEDRLVGMLDEFGQDVDIPALLSKTRKEVLNVDELTSLRTRVGRAIKSERNPTRQAYLKRVYESLIDRVQPARKSGNMPGKAQSRKTLQEIETARGITREFHELFDQGKLGDVLAEKLPGEPNVIPEVTLQELLGTGGSKAVANLDSMLSASHAYGNPDDINSGVRQWLISKFAAKVENVTDEAITNATEAFLRQNRTLLKERYPDLIKTLSDVDQARAIAQSFAASQKSKLLRVDKMFVASQALGENVSLKIHGVMTSGSPEKGMRGLMNAAKRTGDPDVVAGVRGGFYDFMMQQIAPDQGAVSLANDIVIRPGQLRRFLKDNINTIRTVYGESGVKVLREVEKGANMLRRATVRGAGAGKQEGHMLQNMVIRFAGNLGTIIGSRLGLGTHQLLAAGIGRYYAQTVAGAVVASDSGAVYELVAKMLADPDFAKMMLKKYPAPKVIPRTGTFGQKAKGIARDYMTKAMSETEAQLMRYGIIQEIVDQSDTAEIQ